MITFYFERHWDEPTGDPLTNAWGTATYYFETDNSGRVLRQIEVYQNGRKLKYDQDSSEDEYGRLADQPLDLQEFAECSIAKDKFETIWLDQN